MPVTGVFIALSILLSASSAAADSDWIEARSPSFLLQGPVSEPLARELVGKLEILHRLLAERVDAADVKPTVVLAFKDHQRFSRYGVSSGNLEIGGYFVRGPQRQYIVIDASQRSRREGSVYHEYLHAFAARNFPRMPLWFQEGVAELYSTLEIDGGVARIGLPSREHLELLERERWLPLPTVLAPESQVVERSALATRLFYAQSWLLVHYLSTHERHASQLAALLERLTVGDDLDRALVSTLGIGPAVLERELRRYGNSRAFRFLHASVEHRGRVPVSVRRLSRAESLARLGDLLFERPEPRAAQARRHFERALLLDPEQHLARAGLKRLDALQQP